MDINGSWENQNGSSVEFVVDANGRISGQYRSRKGRAVAGLSYPISGSQNGELVAFHVNWRDSETNLHAITSFAGRCTVNADGCDVIHTVWVLARQFEDDTQAKPTQPWNTFLTNADVFLRMS